MGNADNDATDMTEAPFYVWVGLILMSAVSFWSQAVVTEERFVPSLNVIATRFNIPDDVAGATLMATGASAPELLASMVSLFITHSSLGLGTIVGSEIFNHLIICAGSILAARNHRLQLDRAILLREVSFYGLALGLLLFALSDRRQVDDDGEYIHIFISFGDAALLVLAYIAYILVCAYYENILAYIGVDKQCSWANTIPLPCTPDTWVEEGQEPIITPEMPFLRQVLHEPSKNFHGKDGLYSASCEEAQVTMTQLFPAVSHPAEDTGGHETVPKEARRRLVPFHFLVHTSTPKLSKIHGLEEIVRGENGDISCFLWQRSEFYSMAKVAVNAWQLRWFTFHEDHIVSLPDRSYGKDEVTYPPFSRIDVDEAHLIMRLHSIGAGNHKYIMMAPTSDIFQAANEAFQGSVPDLSGLNQSRTDSEATIGANTFASFVDVEKGLSLVAFPFGATPLQQFLHVVLFPLKLLLHLTIPDVRRVTPEKLEPSLLAAGFGVVSCICWLVIGSFAMVISLERLGALMKIPDSVIGITVSAAGTSLPNYIASRVAARQGMGNMAVSNAFGSNIFNILIGLGVPWTLYTGFVTRGGEYSGLRDDGIAESVFILAGVLLLFVILLVWSNFILCRWHAYAFIGTYVLYLVYAIGQVYV